MTTPSFRFLAILLGALALVIGCGGPPETPGEGGEEVAATADVGGAPLRIAVVNYPLRYFTERIGAAAVEVVFSAPPGIDPATWSPTAEVVAEYQSADLVLLNGAGYAKWVERVSLSERKKVDTSAGFSDRLIPLEEALTHGHGPEGEHSHEGLAFTIWLDPTLAIAQAEAVTAVLVRARPAEASAFEARLAELRAELETVDERLAATARALDQRPVLFSHPVYQYLEARYDLVARSLHWEPGESPDESAWIDLERLRADHPAEVMIWEGDPTPLTRSRLEGLGISIVVLDPCGNTPEEGDLLSVLNRGVSELEAALG